jgi:hypothetical protein
MLSKVDVIGVGVSVFVDKETAVDENHSCRARFRIEGRFGGQRGKMGGITLPIEPFDESPGESGLWVDSCELKAQLEQSGRVSGH